jgi:hypothetical protein
VGGEGGTVHEVDRGGGGDAVSKPLTREVKMFVIEWVLAKFTFIDYCAGNCAEEVRAWREKGYDSPAAAAKKASGCGGFGFPVGGSLKFISTDNYSAPDGFEVTTGDGQEGVVTYEEIADVALGKKLSEQMKLFEEATL